MSSATNALDESCKLIVDFDSVLRDNIQELCDLADQIGHAVRKQTQFLSRGLTSQRRLLVESVRDSGKPDRRTLLFLLRGTKTAEHQATAFRDAKSYSRWAPHLKAVCEATKALRWVECPKPEIKVRAAAEAAEFYVRFVERSYGGERLSRLWALSLRRLLERLAEYVSSHHPDGVDWGDSPCGTSGSGGGGGRSRRDSDGRAADGTAFGTGDESDDDDDDEKNEEDYAHGKRRRHRRKHSRHVRESTGGGAAAGTPGGDEAADGDGDDRDDNGPPTPAHGDRGGDDDDDDGEKNTSGGRTGERRRRHRVPAGSDYVPHRPRGERMPPTPSVRDLRGQSAPNLSTLPAPTIMLPSPSMMALDATLNMSAQMLLGTTPTHSLSEAEWRVMNQHNVHDIAVVAVDGQSVQIRNCHSCTIVVTGEAGFISLERCRKVSLTCVGAADGIDVADSRHIVLTVTGSTPLLDVDACCDLVVALSKTAANARVYTAECDDVRLVMVAESTTGREPTMYEHRVPDRLVTTLDPTTHAVTTVLAQPPQTRVTRSGVKTVTRLLHATPAAGAPPRRNPDDDDGEDDDVTTTSDSAGIAEGTVRHL